MGTITTLPWFEVFHAGKHTDRHGQTLDFSRADLEQVVSNFEPGKVPLIISHPEADTPVYGFAQSIKLSDDDKLYLDGDQVNVEFAKSVITGSYGRRSLGLKRNKQKGWYIDHVAFLGAQAPALDLQPVGQYHFAAEQEPAPHQFEFSIETQTADTLVRLMRGLRDFFVETLGIEKANQIVDKWELDWLQRASVKEDLQDDHLHPEFSKPKAEDDMGTITQEQLDAAIAKAAKDAADNTKAEFSQSLSDAEARAKAAEDKLAKAEFAKQVADNQKLVDAAVTAGKLTPAQAAGYAEFMAHLQALDGDQAFEFSRNDGDNKEQVKSNLFEFAKQHLDSLGTRSPLGDAPELHNAGPAFSDDELDAKAVEYQKKHDCDYVTAVTAVSGGAQ
ncbi:hypothetical protein GCM10027098_16270 [Bowmanella dokdonensis]